MFGRYGASVEFVSDWQIGGALLRLAAQAQQRLTLVSPYNKHWGHLKREVSAARARGVAVTMYYRADEPSPAADYEGVTAIPVRMLHAKIYASESVTLVTTMNLVEASATHAREVGFPLRDAGLRKEVDAYIKALADGVEVETPPDIRATEWNGAPPRPAQVETASDIIKIIGDPGTCIECGAEVSFNPLRPLCTQCYSRYGRNGAHRYCHRCREPYASQINQPICPTCVPAHSATD